MDAHSSVEAALAALAAGQSNDELIDQPDRPSELPIRVPVRLLVESASIAAHVLGSTANVLLVECTEPLGEQLPLGASVCLDVEWDQQRLEGRVAAHGIAGRLLVSLGARAIRRTRRFSVSLEASAKVHGAAAPWRVRIVDLSAGGARLRGIDLPVGSEFELTFQPPKRPAAVTMRAFVVRTIEAPEGRMLGVAFRAAVSTAGKAAA
jgi:hypothetical protein